MEKTFEKLKKMIEKGEFDKFNKMAINEIMNKYKINDLSTYGVESWDNLELDPNIKEYKVGNYILYLEELIGWSDFIYASIWFNDVDYIGIYVSSNQIDDLLKELKADEIL